MFSTLIGHATGYSALFLLCAVSGILVPVPEDVSLLYAGSRLQAGELEWAPTLLVAMAGVLVRDLVAYGLGRSVGEWILGRPRVVRVIGAGKLARAHALVERRGTSAVLTGRFLVGVRASVFLVTGAMGVPLRRFLMWDSLGLLITTPLLLLLGYTFGQPVADGLMWFVRHSRGAVVLVVLVGGIILWLHLRSTSDRESDPVDVAASQDDSPVEG